MLTKKWYILKKKKTIISLSPYSNHFLKVFYNVKVCNTFHGRGQLLKVEHCFCLDWRLNNTILNNKTLIILKNNYL